MAWSRPRRKTRTRRRWAARPPPQPPRPPPGPPPGSALPPPPPLGEWAPSPRPRATERRVADQLWLSPPRAPRAADLLALSPDPSALFPPRAPGPWCWVHVPPHGRRPSSLPEAAVPCACLFACQRVPALLFTEVLLRPISRRVGK